MNIGFLERPLQFAHPGADDGTWTRASGENEISDPDFAGQLRGTKRLGVLIDELESRDSSIGGERAVRQLLHLGLAQPEEHDPRSRAG